MKKLTLTLILILSANLLASEIFNTTYSFKNVSVNYLDWSSKTEETTPQKDFAYLEFEGGAGFSWGDFYMFLDIENPTKSYTDEPADNLRVAFKPVLSLNVLNNISLYFQSYTLQSEEFYTVEPVLGVSYKLSTENGFWIQPFVGFHYQDNTYYSGMNGYMLGWTFLYPFSLSQQKFSISQWHEHTFERDDENIGTQGALAFWWHPVDTITAGFQYRYAKNELGNSEYQDALIYSLKYNF